MEKNGNLVYVLLKTDEARSWQYLEESLQKEKNAKKVFLTPRF